MGGLGVVAFYSYYGAALTVGVTSLVSWVVLAAKKQWRAIGKLAIVGGICGVLALPLLLGWLPDQLYRGVTSPEHRTPLGSLRYELVHGFQLVRGLALYQVIGFHPLGWPWPKVPPWLIWVPVLALYLLKFDRHIIQLPGLWLATTFIAYYAAGRWGLLPFGARYSLILSPLLLCCFAGQLVKLAQWGDVVLLVVLSLFMVVSLLSPPEPQEDLRSITAYWLAHRVPEEATYIYNGAAPGFRYQLDLIKEGSQVPPLWYKACWQGAGSSWCSQDDVFYGRWLRHLTPEEKLGSTQICGVKSATAAFHENL